MNDQNDYLQAFNGSFTSTLRWHQLDALWQTLKQDADAGWYIYAIGEPPPTSSADAGMVLKFIDGIDQLLRDEHDEDYCGIVYADNLAQPGFIKIYDPNNLGVSCGYSDNPPLPGWVLSKLAPVDLPAVVAPKNRKRWWQALWRKP
ncbi:MAG: hypothetical protein B6D72_12005 [gamma proteobacterium symbiont of Ctena orbiculata]|uniref:Uncharacterized protein n=1 Tax=Candidatus Thiodiazotropha taylori TaxID=2792791 RepID=A0A944M5F1_9GAMM|nr:hypothetical protein [Candidatus Thiodiazotropha taylori]PUB86678.1 MAG: hypothetical protein DBP00_11245 [gamma proteobacterium symbiont of Ctena orbiculata]MBT2987816.1 hypothetical protein [Candidatus Thiodiazotropha taylori]MBT2995797.1 hypothetical protein [Candidatus Thiodiazotropha taylori]MBT2999112.1 hypothetical protein [Candidatus Thiodiazotropha taylori]